MSANTVFPEVSCRHLAPSEKGLGSFIGRMRFHQSWFRHTILGLQPGPNPHAHQTLYGNMLRPEDGAAGKNFLTPYIFQVAQGRFPHRQKSSDVRRLYNNLLGSQPMAFNLFGPLKQQPIATTLFRMLPGFPEDGDVDDIIFEYPLPSDSPLGDHTAFDVFVMYVRGDGRKGFIGIETKLTEPFSKQPYSFNRYTPWQQQEGWWWKGGAEKDFESASYNQLWRNHLLSFAMLHKPKPEYDEGFIAVVHPLADTECVDAIEKYREVLLTERMRTFLRWPLETIAERWAPVLESEHAFSEWFDLFQTRYLRLDRSEVAWHACLQTLPHHSVTETL
jgi:hypothetical protein